MVRSAKPVGEYPGYCNNGYGSGLVQGKAAYEMLLEQGCEGAGGPVVSNPAKNAAKGGCEQNSDYVASGNKTYRDVCPGAQLDYFSSGNSIISSWNSASLVGMIVVSSLALFSIV